MRIPARTWAAAAAIALAASSAPPATMAQDRFDGLAGGPYDRLVIRNVMVIPGHGGPPAGPFDVVIERNVIAQMIPFDPVTAARRGESARPTGDLWTVGFLGGWTRAADELFGSEGAFTRSYSALHASE